MKRYTQEQIEWLREYVPGHSYKAVWEAFNKRYPDTQVSNVHAMGSLIKRHGLTNGIDEKFKKGQVSFNKGLKQSDYMSPEALERTKATRFKKGNIPHNYKPVGSTRLNVDGYIEVKVADPRTWELRARLVWKEKYGEIPESKILLHINGIRDDDRIENLMLVSRCEELKLNQDGLCVEGATEINTSAIALAKVKAKISERRRVSTNGK